MTGRYSHCNGLMGLVNLGWSLPVREKTIVDYLGEGGYQTVNCGIQHERHPREDNRYQVLLPSLYVEEAVVDAIRYLEGRGSSDPPFYLNLATMETHPSRWQTIDRSDRLRVYRPGRPEEAYVPPFVPDTAETRREMAAFQACIRYTDREIQHLFDEATRLGLRDDTIIVFTNDHGVAAHRAKITAYEHGTEISLLIQAPGVRGETVDHLVQNIDLVPTLLEAAGLEIPRAVQGRSFWPLLTGGDYLPHEQIFTERNYHQGFPPDQRVPSGGKPHHGYDPMRSVRTGRYHYIRHFAENPRRYWLPREVVGRLRPHYNDWWDHMWPEMTEPRPREELFDLARDPHEEHDLAADPSLRRVRDDLAARLARWMRETDDPILSGPIPDRMNGWPRA
jgi:arylsulfatase A-like enzyme